jgi:hypothetical protein
MYPQQKLELAAQEHQKDLLHRAAQERLARAAAYDDPALARPFWRRLDQAIRAVCRGLFDNETKEPAQLLHMRAVEDLDN